MLPREHNGVVDPTLTVYGTSNLRVVDASIFPIVRSRYHVAVASVSDREMTAYRDPSCRDAIQVR